jgi:nucleoside-diphosphate-sugar epimerase
MRIFLAGAAGVIGRRLIPLLQAANDSVVGTTRSADRAAELKSHGVEPVIVDMLDGDAVLAAVKSAQPDVVIHQLTDLPKTFEPALMAEARKRNARLREEATPLLMRAAQAANVRRVVVQSICFAYAAGPTPHEESAPLESPSIRTMEHFALHTSGVSGVVLRYGRLWGPDTWTEVANDSSPLHVDAAAHAAFLAIDRGAGIYNIAEDDGTVSIAKAQRELGFDPNFRITSHQAESPNRS